MDKNPLLTQNSTPFPITEIEFHPQHHPQSHPRPRRQLHRVNTAPAITILHSATQASASTPTNSPNSILKSAALLLVVYLCLGVTLYSLNHNAYSGTETHPAVDAFYFCILTLCTIGYGDITPATPFTKIISCVFVLVGFGIIDVFLSGAVCYVLDVQENLLLTSARARAGAVSYIFDAEKGRMRIRMKVGLAIGVVILCISAGTVALYYMEDLDLVDSFYLSVMSVTTVGYGDRAFKTLQGRVFASFWLLISTLAVARAFLYLAEARIDKRHRRIAKLVLQRDLTVEDLFAADLNHNGFISKSDFVIYKLKEMGKITQNDILLTCNQFDTLDPNNTGKITLPHLTDSNSRQPC